MHKIRKLTAILLAATAFTAVCFAEPVVPFDPAAQPVQVEAPMPEAAAENISQAEPPIEAASADPASDTAVPQNNGKTDHAVLLQIIYAVCIIILFGVSIILGFNIITINKKLVKLNHSYDKLKSLTAKVSQQNIEQRHDTNTSKNKTSPHMTDEEKRKLMHEKFGSPKSQSESMTSAPSKKIMQTVNTYVDIPPEPIREKTDEEKFMDFFDGDSKTSLPQNFNIVKLSMNSGSVFTDPSGYECYIHGDADAIGDIKLYPSKLVKSPQMRQYYSAVFDFVSGNGDSTVIIPCDAERNAYGGYIIKNKGKVIL